MIVSLDDVRSLRAKHRNQRIGYAVGTFDLFHVGHLNYLEWAWNNCDLLFVCVRSDTRVRQTKGAGQPIFPENERARIIDNFKGVAFTLIANDKPDTLKPSIKVAELLRPDVVILGNDWSHEAPLWRKALRSSKIIICPIPYTHSTSRTINRIRHGV